MAHSLPQPFHQILKRERSKHGWTQSALAELLGIDANTVSRWERGSHVPFPIFRTKLSELFGIPLEELGLLDEEPEGIAPLWLSYAQADEPFVTRLKQDLESRELRLLSEEAREFPTSERQEVVRKALQEAHALILIASLHTFNSQTIQEELRLAEQSGCPVCVLWMAGHRRQDVLPPLQTAVRALDLIDARPPRYERAIDELITVLRTLPPPSLRDAETVVLSPTFEPRDPYKGLRAFRYEDAHDFFGRERLIDGLVNALEQHLALAKQQAAARFLAVVGPSGSGKSSVLLAGLLPRLHLDELPGSSRWVYLPAIVPGKHPLEALATTLGHALRERSLLSLREDLTEESGRGLHMLATQLAPSSNAKVVLIVDQCEELFTQTTDELERQHFINLLVTASTEPGGPLLLILTLRGDFYDRPMYYPELGSLIEQQSKSIFPLNRQELQAAIEKPAMLADVQVTFEEHVIGNLLAEVQEQPGALPLLQFVLEQLFERRSGHRLTLSAYHQIGGVKGALAQHAEATYAALPTEEHRRLARALCLRLIDPGTTEQDITRRRAALAEFSLTDETATRLVRETADAFIAARLLTTNELGGVTTLEVSHEAVIREWKRLADWIYEAREDLHLLRVIREDAAEWNRYDRSPDRLYRGTQLAEALAWRERSLLSLDEQAFLEAGAAEQARQDALVTERQQQEAWQRKRYTRRTVLMGLAGVGLAVVAAGVSIELFGRNEPSPPRLPALALPSSLHGHTDAVTSVAWSPDESRLASAGADGTVRVWDATNGQSLLTYHGHPFTVTSLAWSPDGKRLASASLDQTVQVWDATSGATRLTYQGHPLAVTSVAWSPDGKRLASASLDQTVQVWDASSGQLLVNYHDHPAAVTSVAWSPDGKRLASASFDHTMQIWSAATGEPLLTYRGHTDSVTSVAWSPDGKRLASASFDRTVRVWDAVGGNSVATSEQPLLTYTGHTDSVSSVVWSPDGKRLASASADHTARVWHASSGQPLLTYTGHTGRVTSVAWSPDGKRLASASADKTVQVWDASSHTASAVLTYRGHTDSVYSVAWSPDGRRLASGSPDRTVQVWDAASGETLFTYLGHNNVVTSVAWSPDGKRIASGSVDETVQVWDAASGQPLLTYVGHASTSVYSVTSVAWSPDGKRLASASNDTTVQVWDAASGEPLLTYQRHALAVTSVAWSPDGKRLASTSVDDTVRVWDATSGQTLVTYTGHAPNSVYGVAWSPDGRYLASGSGDRTVQVWDAASGEPLLTYQRHALAVNSVAWSLDGKRIASGSGDRTVQVWDAASGQPLLNYTGHSDVVNSVVWSPDGKRIASGSGDRTVQVWPWLQD